MTQQPTIMISLPVADLEKSVPFYEALGFKRSNQFPGEGGAHLVLSETISVILLSHSVWQALTPKQIPDLKKYAQVGFNLSCDSRAAVDAMIAAGVAAGGIADTNPVDDYEFMYGRSLEDLDGHIWEAKWMDMSAMAAMSAT